MPLLLEVTIRSTALWLIAWLLLKSLRVRDAHAREGQVTHASVVKEKPAGVGLGEAAGHAARTFRFNNTLSEPVIRTIQVAFALKD